MTQTCRPIDWDGVSTDPKYNVTSADWAMIAGGGGIVKAKGSSESDLTLYGDTATIGDFTYRMDGHKLAVAGESFTLASASVTYAIGIRSDPSKDGTTGRLSLQAVPKASVPVAGTTFDTLKEVTRTTGSPMSATTPQADLRRYACEVAHYPAATSPSDLPAAPTVGMLAVGAERSWLAVATGPTSTEWVSLDSAVAAQYLVASPAQAVAASTLSAVRWSASPSRSGVVTGSWSLGGAQFLVRVPEAGWYDVQSTVSVSVAQPPGSYLNVRPDPGPAIARAPFCGDGKLASCSMKTYIGAGGSVKAEAFCVNGTTINGGHITVTRTGS